MLFLNAVLAALNEYGYEYEQPHKSPYWITVPDERGEHTVAIFLDFGKACIHIVPSPDIKARRFPISEYGTIVSFTDSNIMEVMIAAIILLAERIRLTLNHDNRY